jgi:KaiC/GvpD/RAD55 family RecA-like ATPase
MSGATGRVAGRESTSAALADTTGENLLVSGGPLVGKRAFVVDVATAAAAAGRDVLVVTATSGAGSLPERLRASGNVAVVDCSPAQSDPVGSVSTVSSPADLTGVSMPVSRFLADADSPVVVVDSISTFLVYADEAPVFRFLSVLTAHVRRSEGVGLYTIDQGAHTEQTFRTFVQLFDGEVGLRVPAAEGADADAAGDADTDSGPAAGSATTPTATATGSPPEVRVRGLAGFDGEWHPS